MPLGFGYSVEQQVTGKEFIGGIQLEITPQIYSSSTQLYQVILAAAAARHL